jgi:hypothetical protein
MQAATGMGYKQCRLVELDKRSWWRLPVPDPVSPEQARFEAIAVKALAVELGDRQVGGAVLGVEGVDLQSDRLICWLHPVMARRVVSTLLPRFDHEHGGIEGIPGARPKIVDGNLRLADLFSDASLELRVRRSRQPLVPLTDPGSGVRPLWRLPGPTVEEVEERAWWGSDRNLGLGNPAEPGVFETRDLLFSRLLRRPGITNRVAHTHGLVNSFTHGENVILEWCCGASAEQISKLLDESGLSFRLSHVAPWAGLGLEFEYGDISIDRLHASGRRGLALLTLRSGQPCPDPRFLAPLWRVLGAWYECAHSR